MIYFTSDTHFNHAKVIEYCARPYPNTDAMNTAIIDNWNARVTPEDTIYHLGDFAMGQLKYAPALFDRLKGRKVLIKGNHDPKKVRALPWAEVHEGPLQISIGSQLVVMLHYPMVSWNHKSHGAIHLHGHSHGSLPGTRQRVDVGVDCWDMKPCTLDEINARRETMPILTEESHNDKSITTPWVHDPAEVPPLVLMVGPSGAGKSTLLANMVAAGRVRAASIISADAIRFELFGDDYYPREPGDKSKYNPSDNARVFSLVHRWARARLDHGLPVVLDETHLTARSRRSSLALVSKTTPVEYWVVNRPLSAKRATGGWRLIDPTYDLIGLHDATFNADLANILAGDGRPNVTVRNFIKET